MINKYFENPKEKDDLLKMTIDEIRENAINELLKPEHQRIKELEEKTEKLEEKSKKIEEKSEKLEKTIQTLQKNGGLNSKGLEIINSIMLTK